MRKKEEILLLKKEDLNNPCFMCSDIISPTQALEAMEEYSEEMACGFVDWKDKLKPAKDKDCFTNLELGIGVKLKPYKELYQIYLEHLNK